MLRKITLIMFVLALSLTVAVSAFADAPDFSPHIYADGEAWGTKVTTILPAPQGNNLQSFDKFFVFTNGAEGQLPVGEAAPGRGYNGGRWWTWTATWEDDVPHDIPVLTSYDGGGFYSIMFHVNLGHLTIMAGSPDGGPPPYFQCPLLPVK